MRISPKTSFTSNAPEVGCGAPPRPARSPEVNSPSNEVVRASRRYSAPTLRPTPSLAHGDLMPYLERSPVMLALTTCSLVAPSDAAVVSRYLSCAAVTPPGNAGLFQMFQGK